MAALPLRADPFTDAPAPKAERSRVLHASVAKQDGKETKTFLTGTSKILGIWKGEKLKAGDVVRAIWIAESFGAAQKDVKITEVSTTAYKPDDEGIFSLLRPAGGWPIGRYRVEFYVQDRLADTARFTVDADVTVEVR